MDIDALERRLETLEQSGRRSRRRLIVAILATLSIAVPATVVASHQFSDVPSGYLFHGDIDHVADAGITSGCGGGKYCPADNVTRGQMAAFLARTGGRVAYDSNGFVFGLTSTKQELASVTIRGPNPAGGTVFVKLEVAGFAYTNGDNETGCAPCTVLAQIEQDGAEPGLNLRFAYATLTNVSGTQVENAPFTISYVTPISTGTDHTFRVFISRTGGTGTVNAIGSLAATYFPFSGDGDDTMP